MKIFFISAVSLIIIYLLTYYSLPGELIDYAILASVFYILFPFVTIIVLNIKRSKNIDYSDFRKSDRKIIGALFIDLMFMLLLLGLFSYVSIFILKSKYLFTFCIELLIIYYLLSNVFFRSVGFVVFGLYNKMHCFSAILNNIVYALFLFGVKNNYFFLLIILGLYAGLDAMFMIIKGNRFLFYIFNISIYSKKPFSKPKGKRKDTIHQIRKRKGARH
jgi:hypothetical protein